MIHIQLLSDPHPHPSPLRPPRPPQQQRRIMIQRQELLHPPQLLIPDSHPHPQFVALKSLIDKPPYYIVL